MALSQLQKDVGMDKMLYISYHLRSDPFQNGDATGRAGYYGVPGTPDTWAGGTEHAGGSTRNVQQDSMRFAQLYNNVKDIPSPLTITVTGNYNVVSRSGWVKTTITNTGGSDIQNHALRYALIESVYYPWGGGDSCLKVERKMLPNYSGVPFSLNAGATKVDSQSFTMDAGWLVPQTRLVAFVQSDEYGEVVQGGWASLSSFTGAEGGTPEHQPIGVTLAQNQPNPAKGNTEIAFSLPKTGEVRLVVYDVQGRLVRTVGEGMMNAGTHRIHVSGLGSGVYLYRLETGGVSLTRMMVVAK